MPKKEKKKKQSKISFYIELLHDLITKGMFDSNIDIPHGKLYLGSGFIKTTRAFSRYYIITELPKEVDEELVYVIRNIIKQAGADCNVYVYLEPYTLNMKSLSVRNRISIWKSKYESVERKSITESRTERIFKREEEVREDEDTIWMIDSWEYILNMIRNKRELAKVNIIIELHARTLEILNEAEDALMSYFYYSEIKAKRIVLNILDFLRGFSITSLDSDALSRNMYNAKIITDETISNLLDYSQGTPRGKGVYLGSDIFTLHPIFYDFRQKDRAMNIMITGETGSGKSCIYKSLMGYLYLDGYYQLVIDYEGDEYLEHAKMYKATVINMSGENGYYFDTLEIGDLTGDPDVDANLRAESINATKLVFDVLCDLDNGMTPTQLAIFNDALTLMYKNFGITDDKSTWANSKKLSYKILYEHILKLAQMPEYREKYSDELDKFIDILRVYFSPNGIKSGLFKNRLSIRDVVKNRITIFSFGMRGVASNVIDDKELALKQLFVSYISNLAANYVKKMYNEYTFMVYEELQRYGHLRGSGDIITNTVTGARKRNMRVILITNSPTMLLDTNSPYFKAITENINGFIIGALKQSTRELICSRFNMEHAKKWLDIIADNQKYKHCFLLNMDGNMSIIKVLIPQVLIKETGLYGTKEVKHK